MIGVIGGVGFSKSEVLRNAELEEVTTPFGDVTILITDRFSFIPRHGIEENVPPHKINHQANISAFMEKGIKKIIGVNSVGSLNFEIAPPKILIPHDYINFWDVATFFHDKIVHVVPGLDEELRRKLILIAEDLEVDIVSKGVYIQTSGPRLETKAEIKMLEDFGDVVGMTMASEATLARERGLGFASICSVDNYAHGITDEPLTNEIILENARMNGEKIAEFLLKVGEDL
jgi:5'-methylthioadenosine phosphorylase